MSSTPLGSPQNKSGVIRKARRLIGVKIMVEREDWIQMILKYLERATVEQLELIWLAVAHMVR